MKPSPFAIETCAEPGWKKPQAARVHAFHAHSPNLHKLSAQPIFQETTRPELKAAF